MLAVYLNQPSLGNSVPASALVFVLTGSINFSITVTRGQYVSIEAASVHLSYED